MIEVRKRICILLILVIILPIFPAPTYAASGTEWSLSGEGVLTINNDIGMTNWINDSSLNTTSGSALRAEIKEINILNGTNSIDSFAFEECFNLESITIPDTVTSIGDYAFTMCSNLNSINIPGYVTSIGINAFGGCSNLTSINIPDSVKNIQFEAFSGCHKLESIVIPSSIKTIKFMTFFQCYNLNSVTIPDSVTSIEIDAFTGCNSLTSVTIPNSVTSIGNYAFAYCTNLLDIEFKGAPPTFGTSIFDGSNNLESIIVPINFFESYKAVPSLSCYIDLIKAEINIVTALIADGKKGDLYSKALQTENAVPATWSIISGSLPTGISLTPEGIISGTPNVDGTFNLTIRAENSISYDTKAFTLIIAPADIIPTPQPEGNSSNSENSNRDRNRNKEPKSESTSIVNENILISNEIKPIPEVSYLEYTDVSPNDWFYEAVRNITSRGWMIGTSKNTFSPNLKTNRAMFITTLYNIAGSPEINNYNKFNDVSSDRWYYSPVLWASHNNIISGYTDDTFKPNDELTREQMVMILYSFSNFMGYDMSKSENLDSFSDSEKISSYAKDAMNWAIHHGIISGTGDSRLSPKSTATRAQIAVILDGFSNKFMN